MVRVHPEGQENPVEQEGVQGVQGGTQKKLKPFPSIHLEPLPLPREATGHRGGRRHSFSDAVSSGLAIAQTSALPSDLIAGADEPWENGERKGDSRERGAEIQVLVENGAAPKTYSSQQTLRPRLRTSHSQKCLPTRLLSAPVVHGGSSFSPRILSSPSSNISPRNGATSSAAKTENTEHEEDDFDELGMLQGQPVTASVPSSTTSEGRSPTTVVPLRRSLNAPQGSFVGKLQHQDTCDSLTPSVLAQQSPMVKSRWGQAVWYAAQEAERKKEEQEDDVTPLNQVRRASLAALHGERSVMRRHRQNSTSSLTGSDGMMIDHAREAHEEEEKQNLKGLSWAPGPMVNAWKDIVIDLVCPFYILVPYNIYLLVAPPSELADDIVVGLKGCVCFILFIDWIMSILNHEQYLEYVLSWRGALKFVCVLVVVPDAAWLCARHDLVRDNRQLGLMRDMVEVGALVGQAIVSYVTCLRTFRAHQLLKETETGKAKKPEEEEEQRKNGWSQLSSQITDSVVLHMVVGSMLLFVAGAVLPVIAENDAESARVAVNMMRVQHRSGPPLHSTAVESQLLGAYLEEMEREEFPVLYLEVDNDVLYGDVTAIESKRLYPREVKIVELADPLGGPASVVHLDISARKKRRYWGQLLVSLITFVMAASWMRALELSLRFLIVRPMERMLITVSSMIRDPLKLLPPLNEMEAILHPETSFVEGALIKVGSLLQLAFGEAGKRIIKKNLGASGTMEMDTKGATVHAIFGFCDIRNFTGLTEVLQADVGKLVNCIATVVHEGVAAHHGAPNKNIGDAFLLVWQPKGKISLKLVADSALRSYVQIIVMLRKSSKIKAWERRHEVQRWIPGFTVHLGYGLHFGWAIECAIGSKRKVDASYLSPHVNLASRLEAATKQYGTKILMSGDIVNLLSEKVRQLVRLLDRVTVKGGGPPIVLRAPYTVSSTNINHSALPAQCPVLTSSVLLLPGSENPMDLYTYDVAENTDHVPASVEDLGTEDFWDHVPPCTDVEFRTAHRNALELYLGGQDGTYADWPRACEMLAQWPEDGPSAAILEYMRSNCASTNGGAPDWWQGYRGLTDK